jgi:hypothetical protein
MFSRAAGISSRIALSTDDLTISDIRGRSILCQTGNWYLFDHLMLSNRKLVACIFVGCIREPLGCICVESDSVFLI